MRIRAGYNLTYECPQPTPMLLVLEIHPSRRVDLLTEQIVNFDPPIESRAYIDGFGNACTRIEAPAGLTTISTDFQIYDSGKPDVVALDAVQHDIKDLPDDVLVFLLGSRYCDTDRLGDFAWATFGGTQPGWSRVQAICDFVHSHISLQLSKCRCSTDRARRIYRQDGRVPGFRPPCDYALPLHEHSSAILHGLSRRYWHPACTGPDGLQRLVRGLSQWALVHVRRQAQHPADWTNSDGHGSRCNRCRAFHQLWFIPARTLRSRRRRGPAFLGTTSKCRGAKAQ